MRIRELYRYPLTGARGIRSGGLAIDYTGPSADRRYVLYDSALPGSEKNRISQKQHPKLATAKVQYDDDAKDAKLVVSFPGDPEELIVDDITDQDVTVNEFGQETPCFDCGDIAAERFARFLGLETVRLAEKRQFWLDGGNGTTPAANRTVSPLHIINAESITAISETLGEEVLANRFRPNIVIDDLASFTEETLVGKILKIGVIQVVVTRLTVRCLVPGIDQDTGENKKDVPKVYRSIQRKIGDEVKPVFGVYACPIVPRGYLRGYIVINDEIEVA